MYMYCYRQASMGGKALAQALGVKRIKHKNSAFNGGKRVINWGASKVPDWDHDCEFVNPPSAVAETSNKLKFFRLFRDADFIPIWTTDKDQAQRLLDAGHTIVCRQKLTGHSGEGIVIVEPGQELVDAKLYVQYMKKTDEFRVHIMDGQVVDLQRKARKRAVPDDEVNWQVRNKKGGFIYQRNDIVVPDRVQNAALEAFGHSRLDFGAVDVLWHEPSQRAYVLEINTAPGLKGTTLDNYRESFLKFFPDFCQD